MINKYSKSLDNNFYKKNIKVFYKLLNNVICGKFFRICLGIKLPMSNKIGLLHTNGYSVDLGNGNLRAELWNYDITSIRLYKMFGWLFAIFHWFDLYVANKYIPSLNLGFDNYEDVEIDVVIAGTTGDGYVNYDIWKTFSTIRSASGTTATSNNIMIARLLASRWDKFCLLSRGIISYNTGFLTYNDVITSADLRLYLANPVNYTSSFPNDNLVITSHNKVTSYAMEDNSLLVSDYLINNFGTTSFAELTWANYVLFSPTNYVFSLNQSGKDYIRKGQHTAFGLMLSLDMQNLDPSDPNVIQADETYYTIQLPTSGPSFTIDYTSLDYQIVMIM